MDDSGIEGTWDDIDPALRTEICGAIEDLSGIALDETQLRGVLAEDTTLIGAIVEWEVDDTEVTAQLAHKISNVLLHRDWPTFGEGADLAAYLDACGRQRSAMGLRW